MITSTRYPDVSTDVDWLDATIESSGSTARKISFTAAKNDSKSERSGKIYLKYNGSSAGYIIVNQSGKSDYYVFELDPAYELNGNCILYYANGTVKEQDIDYYIISYKNDDLEDVAYSLTNGSLPTINKSFSENSGSVTYTLSESEKTLTLYWKQDAAQEIIIFIWGEAIENNAGYIYILSDDDISGSLGGENSYYYGFTVEYTINYSNRVGKENSSVKMYPVTESDSHSVDGRTTVYTTLPNDKIGSIIIDKVTIIYPEDGYIIVDGAVIGYTLTLNDQPL